MRQLSKCRWRKGMAQSLNPLDCALGVRRRLQVFAPFFDPHPLLRGRYSSHWLLAAAWLLRCCVLVLRAGAACWCCMLVLRAGAACWCCVLVLRATATFACSASEPGLLRLLLLELLWPHA